MRIRSHGIFALSLLSFALHNATTKAAEPQRVGNGLIVLYDFADGQGGTVRDRSASGAPLDLVIETPGSVRWSPGMLSVNSATVIASPQPAKKIIDAVKKSNAITVEAWLKPSSAGQSGPARIVSLSADSGQRNFTLGQDKDFYDVRLRAEKTDNNGLPSTASPKKSLQTKLSHVVFTRDAGGNAVIFVDGRQVVSKKVNGKFSNWSDKFHLSLTNEFTKDRPWLGELHLVAIYDRALSVKDVQQNFAAGAGASAKAAPQVAAITPAKPMPKPEAKPEPKPMPAPTPARPTNPVTLPGDVIVKNVDFERHIVGLLGRLGCNSGSCHGSFQGQNGFRLSLFGYDPKMDHAALTERVDAAKPDDSYALLKATMQDEHKGGKRFEKDSWQYKLLREWIAAGTPWTAGSGTVTEIEVEPKEHRFAKPGEKVRLKVFATFADGSREDVTALTEFRINDDYVAEVSHEGQLHGLRPGDTSIVVSYRGNVLSSRAMIPASLDGKPYPATPEVNYIDREVFTKLKSLNIVPSDLSADTEFLRRIYIDTIGCLPMPDEVRAFVANKAGDKRQKKVDELLKHPLHAALWATKLSDITGNNSEALDAPIDKRSKMWHDWFRKRLTENVPYDEIVRGVLTATSREGKSPEDWIKQATALDQAALKGYDNDYANRPTLDLFWVRKNVSLEQFTEQTAAAFLGVQLECAQCDKHPYDRWTQEDYRAFANTFGPMKAGTSVDAKKALDAENNRRKGIKDKNQQLVPLREAFVDLKGAKRLNHPDTNKPLAPRALGGPELKADSDPRVPLFDWMRAADNPLFARSFVNRVWAHYFGIGIVEPVDAFSQANPPSNEKLLDALAKDFVDHKYDLRHLEREILLSRTYQLSKAPNDTNIYDRNNFSRSYPRRMMAEVVVDVLNSALGVSEQYTRDAPANSKAIEVAATRVQDGNLNYAFRIFGRPPRAAVCDCERSTDPALPQTLFFMTDSSVLNKINSGRLKQLLAEGDRLKKLKAKQLPDEEIGKIVDELFLAMLTRFPSDTEKTASLDSVRSKPGSEAGFVDVAWALINTREFVLNH